MRETESSARRSNTNSNTNTNTWERLYPMPMESWGDLPLSSNGSMLRWSWGDLGRGCALSGRKMSPFMLLTQERRSFDCYSLNPCTRPFYLCSFQPWQLPKSWIIEITLHLGPGSERASKTVQGQFPKLPKAIGSEFNLTRVRTWKSFKSLLIIIPFILDNCPT